MKSTNKPGNQKNKSLEDALKNQTDHPNVSAQKDGFRYDYTDSSDLKDDKA